MTPRSALTSRASAAVSGPSPGLTRSEDRCGEVGDGNELAPQLLREAAQQRGHELEAEAGEVPVETVVGEARECVERDVQRRAVVVGAGLEAVAEAQVAVAAAQRVGAAAHGRGGVGCEGLP